MAALRGVAAALTAVFAVTAPVLGLPGAVLAQDAGSAAARGGEDDDASVRRMQEELRRQEAMLARIQRGESLEDTDLEAIDQPAALGLEDQANPRTAPLAPVDRALPVAIFEQKKVRVEAGRWWDHPRMSLTQRTLDADGDGRPELVRYVDPETGHLFRQEEDRNYDGVTDAWSDYRSGIIVSRVLDSNDDGNPDVWERYHETRMTVREIDRDDDGVRDAFYRYESGSLTEERHDADNDGRVDLRVVYSERHRLRDEEDADKDGRTDTWRSYVVVDGAELVSRIERDKKGRGFADTFETFDAQDGKAVLTKREEDVNGDGEVDITSHYENGKLIRREIANPDLVPL